MVLWSPAAISEVYCSDMFFLLLLCAPKMLEMKEAKGCNYDYCAGNFCLCVCFFFTIVLPPWLCNSGCSAAQRMVFVAAKAMLQAVSTAIVVAVKKRDAWLPIFFGGASRTVGPTSLFTCYATSDVSIFFITCRTTAGSQTCVSQNFSFTYPYPTLPYSPP